MPASKRQVVSYFYLIRQSATEVTSATVKDNPSANPSANSLHITCVNCLNSSVMSAFRVISVFIRVTSKSKQRVTSKLVTLKAPLHVDMRVLQAQFGGAGCAETAAETDVEELQMWAVLEQMDHPEWGDF